VPAPERGAKRLTGAFATPQIPLAALVTGGARRIGRELVLALADAGFAVAVHHHRSRAEAEGPGRRDRPGRRPRRSRSAADWPTRLP